MYRILIILLLVCLSAGCNQTFRFYEFELKGKISVASGKQESGNVVVEIYHKQTGKDVLQQPLLFVEKFTVEKLGDFTKTIEFPILANREGLVVYVWFDRDKNGELCSQGNQEEFAGLLTVSDFPKRTIDINLTLDKKCLGPEALYPVAE